MSDFGGVEFYPKTNHAGQVRAQEVRKKDIGCHTDREEVGCSEKTTQTTEQN